MPTLLQDLRFSYRTLLKSPVFTAVAVCSLALGIGANTAIFTLMDQVLLRMLPIHHPEELVMLDGPGPNQGSIRNDNAFSYPMYTDFRDKNQVFSGVLARFPLDLAVSYHNVTEKANGEIVSGNYFDVLGVKPALGRTFTPDDDRTPGAHPLVVLSYGYWQRRFGGESSILNQSVMINGRPMTVIGVSAPGFHGIEVGGYTDVMVPMMMKAQLTPTWDDMTNRRSLWLNAFARLKPGVSKEQASAAMNVLYKQILNDEIKSIPNATPRFQKLFLAKHLDLLPGQRGRSELRRRFSTPLIVLMSMVGLVLLIACANVANLLMARAASRQREIAIRLALGASRRQIIRQLLVESSMLSFTGGLMGILIAAWTGHALLAYLPFEDASRTFSSSPDMRALLFTLAVSLATGLAFGLVPAWQSTRPAVAETLKNEAGNISGVSSAVRVRKALVVSQVALSLLLLVGAGLFSRSLYNLKSLNPGFHTENLMTFTLDPSLTGYESNRILSFYPQLQQNLQSISGVKSVSEAALAVMTDDDSMSTVSVQGYTPKEGEDMNPRTNEIGPGYFATLGTPIIAGRDISERDGLNAPKVALVNETFAHYFFGDQNPLGRRFSFGRSKTQDIEIIGVVRDGKASTLREKTPRFVYTPYMQDKDTTTMTLYVRTDKPVATVGQQLRQEVRRIDPNLPIKNMKSMTTVVDESLFIDRIIALLSAFFGFLATLLAALGLYGVMAFSVARRTREIGIRIALGAARSAVIGMIMREVAWMAGIGIAIGLPCAIVLSRLIESQLFGLQANDPLTISIATVTLAAVALLSGLVPAQRATKVDPIRALRYD